MFVLADAIPASNAHPHVPTHGTHPATEMARWRVCQSRAAKEGIANATKSEATPTARKSHPAVSVDPRDRANDPFMVTPTAARATAAASSRIREMLCDGAS